MDAQSCQRANWHDLGYRDAIFGLQSQDSIYGSQCQAHGVSMDAARYAEGFREGRHEFEMRTSGSHD